MKTKSIALENIDKMLWMFQPEQHSKMDHWINGLMRKYHLVNIIVYQ